MNNEDQRAKLAHTMLQEYNVQNDYNLPPKLITEVLTLFAKNEVDEPKNPKKNLLEVINGYVEK